MNGLLIWGAGGHAKVVLDCALLSPGLASIAFLDDAAGEERFCSYPVLGGREQLPDTLHRGYLDFVVAIGDNRVRAQCFAVAMQHGLRPVTLIHPSAVVSPSALVSPGTVVMPRAVINAGAVIGQNCIINSGAIVEHDCQLGDHVHLSTGVLLGGGVKIRDSVHMGIGAVALPGAEIGEGAVIGAGAVVLRGVAPRTTVAGVPARELASVHA